MKFFTKIYKAISASILAFLLICSINVKAEDNIKVLVSLGDLKNWQTLKSEEAEIALVAEKGRKGNCMRLNYDFTKRKGYVVVSKDFSFSLPQDYKFIFYIKGNSPDNNLEFKVIDEKGNTYWKKWENFKFTNTWKKMVVSKKKLAFGWGPGPVGELKKVKKIEFGISCGSGGKGSVDVDELTLIAFKEPGPDVEVRTTAASFDNEEGRPENTIDGNSETSWKSKSSNNQWLELDFGQQKEIGGLYIYWDKDYAGSYDIAVSDDGKEWSAIYTVTNGNGGRDRIYFDETQTQFIRVICKKSATKNGFGIKEIEIKAPEEGAALKKRYEIAAQESPKGYYPRWLAKEQAYWTIVGVADDSKKALLCEDGTIEPYKKSFSIMPFLYLDGKLITREDAKVTQSLENDYLPIPSVRWEYKDVVMDLKVFAHGRPKESVAYARYTLTNNRQEKVAGKLFLAIRPFQVYPIWQEGGGFATLHDIRYKSNAIGINGVYKFILLTKPDGFGVQAGLAKANNLPEGDIVNVIQNDLLPPTQDLLKNADWDSADWDASAAIEYDFQLNPAESKECFIAIPLGSEKPLLKADMKESEISSGYKRMLKETMAFWETEVSKFEINIPEVEIINTLKSNIAYNLLTRDGPGFQPGSRNYDKSWIRDGGIVGSILMKMGFREEIKEFIDWYTSYQYETGEIPPIIRPVEGPEPVDEYDSQGEFVFSIYQYYLFTKDKAWLEGKLPNVVKALKYQAYLRSQRLTAEYKDIPEKKLFYGILPDSISHEGYVPPVHSYWDNFWALEGWKAGKNIADALNRHDLSVWAETEYLALKDSVYKSINLAMKEKNINYIPGCAEKGDYDPAATAIAVIYCEELNNLPQPQLKNTFDKYYKDLQRRAASTARSIFGPYELRAATAFTYLGQPERALLLLRYMLTCRQPIAWNQWAEVIDSDYRTPYYLGDIPHTWVGAEYINAVRSLFVYELDDRLILAHGVDEKWLKDGVSVKDMSTYYGNISYNLKEEESSLKVKIWGEAISPAGGFVFKIPLARGVNEVRIDNEICEGFSGDEMVFYKLPTEITIFYK